MKDKLIGILGMLKDNKKNLIKVGVAIVVVILLIVILSAIFSAKPRKYEDKIKDFTKALTSESKMKDLLEKGKIVDLRAAAAFQEADLDYEDLNKEYKSMKKGADEVDDLEKALKAYAEDNEDYKVSVSKIGKPKQNKKNKKVYTVSATLKLESSYGSTDDQSVKFVFYKGKLIDVLVKGYSSDSSMFEDALDANK